MKSQGLEKRIETLLEHISELSHLEQTDPVLRASLTEVTEEWRNILKEFSAANNDLRKQHEALGKRSRADNTEHELTKDGSRESEKQFRLLVSSVTDYALFMLDPEGHVASWNTGAERIKGYRAEEILGRHFSCFYPQEDLERGKPEYALKVTTAEGRYEDEGWRLRKDGTTFWANVIITAMRDESGTLVGFSKVTRDLTRQKETAEALRDSEIRFRSVTQSANAAIVSADTSGIITSWNHGATRIFGYEEAEAVGMPLMRIIPSRYHQAHQRGMERLRAGGESRLIGQTVELHGLKKDGSEFPIELSLSSWTAGQGTFFSGVIQDISDRKQAEEQLKKSLQEARLLAHRLEAIREEERTRIAREVHDELGVTMTCMKFDLLKLDTLLGQETVPSARSVLQQKVQDMLQQVDNTIAQVQRLATELRPGILDDLGLVAAIEWQARDFATRTGITCEFLSRGETPALERSRTTAIFRIFQEALTNVARHAQATHIAVRLWEEGGMLALEVKDDGRGIPKEKLSDIRSLGLVGMRERVIPFGGEVTIKGVLGTGTIVSVLVPLENPPLEEKGYS